MDGTLFPRASCAHCIDSVDTPNAVLLHGGEGWPGAKKVELMERREGNANEVPCAGGLGEGGLGLELGGHAAEAVEAVEGDVRDVAHVGGPPDLHPLLLAAADGLVLLLAAPAAAVNVHVVFGAPLEHHFF